MDDKLRCQLYGKLNVLQRGILHKSWQTRFCVFFVETDGSSPQIHVFEKKELFDKNSKDRKVFPLDEIKKLQYTKEKYGFDVVTKKDKFSFVAENDHDLRLWVRTLKSELNITTILEKDGTPASDEEESDSNLYMDDNIIYESADVTPMFSVEIEDNDAAQRCELRGKYFLVVNLHNLALVDCTTKKAIYQWPFKYIRRFGKTRSNFQFEAGRRCPSGEGEFSFYTDQGFKIFDAFTKTTQKIKNQEDEPVGSMAKTAGHNRAKSEGQNVNHSSALRSSGHHSPTPIVRGTSEAHYPPSSGSADRRSVKSGGHIGHIQDKFASELNTVLKHHQEEHSVPHPPAENLKESGKKEKDKPKSEKEKKSDKKSKKEIEKEAKAREKEEKAREKEEKAREKEEKAREKEERAKDKKGKKKKLEQTQSHPIPSSHMYEEVDEIPSRQISAQGPDPLYAEAGETPAKVIPKPKPRKEQKPESVLYSEPQKLKKDAWKQHGREEQDSEHQEDYDKIRVAASKVVLQKDDPRTQASKVEEVDETYDHIGNLSAKPKSNVQENIYGTASGKTIASIKRDMAEIHDYEEAVGNRNPKNRGNQVDAYEEPMLSESVPAQEEEESAYADIS